MILRSLRIDGFGVHRDLKMEGFEAGLNVVYGENEAGKSTLLHFFRAALYGFDEHKRNQERYETDGVHGGSVTLELEPGERIRFTRHFRAGRRALGELRAEDSNGPLPDAEVALKRALGNSSRALFENIFAIGLDDLRTKVTAEGLREHIYGAGMTGKGASLPGALADLRKKSRDLLPAGAKGGRIGRLLDEMEEMRRQIDELSKRPEAHRALVERIGALSARLREIDEQLPAKKQARDRALRLTRAAEIWMEVAGLPEIASSAPKFPAGGEERLEALEESLGRAKASLERAKTRRDEIARRLDTVAFDSVLVERAAEIDAFHAESDKRLGIDAPGLAAAKAAELATSAARKLDALGSEWDGARVGRFDASAESERELLAASDRAIRSESRAREARRDADHATETEVRNREEIARLLTEIERIGDADEKAAKLEKRVNEFEKTLGEVRSAEILWKDVERRVGLAGVQPEAQAIVADAAGVNRLLYAIAIVATIGGTVLVVRGEYLAGVALFITAVVTVVFSVQRNPNAIPFAGPSGRETEEARVRLERARNSRRDRSIITFERPDAGEEDAHRTRSEIGDLRAQAKRRTEAERTIGEKKVDLGRASRTAVEKRRVADEATAEWEQSKAALKTWLGKHGLDASIAPESARTTLLAVREVQDASRAQGEAESEVERLERAAKEFAERSAALLASLGRPKAASDSATAVHAALTALRGDSLAARAAKEGKARDESDRPRAEEEMTAAAKEVADAEASRVKLFAEADVAGVEAFYAASKTLATWTASREKRDSLEGRLKAALGDEDGDAAREALRRTPREELARAGADLDVQVQRLEKEREEALVEKTKADGERERIENEDQLSALRAAEEAAREDLAAAAESWQRLVATEWLLEAARRKFEAEHQPGILRAAGRFLETITRGRWIAVRSVAEAEKDEDRLRVVRFDDPERLHSVSTLSRGTMEQLYLALRLALASEFPDPGVRLPLILDDVLVNFSGTRRAAAAEAIASISTRVQVIAFTCHAEMRDALLATTKTARRMDLPDPARPDESARKPRGGGPDRQLRLPGSVASDREPPRRPGA